MLTLALVALTTVGSVTWSSGSLVVLEDSNKLVASWTDSNITHLGVLMHKDGQAWIYEATPGTVRRLGYAAYRKELSEQNRRRKQPIRMWIMQPQTPYSQSQLDRMQTYLDGQLGRRYSVKGYIQKRPVEGIHCAELASSALSKGERIVFATPHTQSPGAVCTEVSRVYQAAARVPLPVVPDSDTWCSRAWGEWFGFQTWCHWACLETWQFCW